jgi:hypothetical protein
MNDCFTRCEAWPAASSVVLGRLDRLGAVARGALLVALAGAAGRHARGSLAGGSFPSLVGAQSVPSSCRRSRRMRAATQLGNLLDACLVQVIALTSQRNACRCAAMSPAFRAAADSDHVWRAFLPPQLDDRYRPAPVVLQPVPTPTSKEAYLGLCEAAGAAAIGEDGGCWVWLEWGTGAGATACRCGGSACPGTTTSSAGNSHPTRAPGPPRSPLPSPPLFQAAFS